MKKELGGKEERGREAKKIRRRKEYGTERQRRKEDGGWKGIGIMSKEDE